MLSLHPPGNCSINRWTGAMNYFIHSIMYTYYSFKAFRIFIPRFIAFVITVSQIAQMFIGFYIAGYIFAQNLNGSPCKMSLNQSIFSISVYLFYFALFVNFFLRTYFKPRVSQFIANETCKSKGAAVLPDEKSKLKTELNGKAKDLLLDEKLKEHLLDENGNLSKNLNKKKVN